MPPEDTGKPVVATGVTIDIVTNAPGIERTASRVRFERDRPSGAHPTEQPARRRCQTPQEEEDQIGRDSDARVS